MNEIKKLTLRDRIKDAINAFRGRKIGSLHFGVDLKRCDECEYKNNDIREELLVIAGARAAYMECSNSIKLPEGIEGERWLSSFITNMVDLYLCNKDNTNFDEYIESVLLKRYGDKNVSFD